MLLLVFVLLQCVTNWCSCYLPPVNPAHQQQLHQPLDDHSSFSSSSSSSSSAAVTASVQQCCEQRGVSGACTRMLCNPQNPPNDFDVYNIFERKLNCAPHMETIAACLADGRDHLHCCVSEAKDRDENACFGMCRGEGMDGISAWDKYQTCLAINLHPMFRCFQLGYANTPGPPRTVQVLATSREGADDADGGAVVLSWSSPAANPHLVESYQVVCRDADTGAIEKTVSTRALKATLSSLRADVTYAIHVMSVTRDGRRRSLPSATLHVHTRGVAPRVRAYRETVLTPRDAHSITLACQTQVSGGVRIHWLNANGEVLGVHGDKYSVDSYTAEREHPPKLVSTLLIKRLSDGDFGTYRCVATNQFGTASAELHVAARTATAATSIPPEPPHACCNRLGIRSPCAMVCGTALGKRAALRADAFMSGGCVDEVGKLLTCTVAGIDDGVCCLRRRVPAECMPLCDGSQQPPAHSIPHACAAHTYAIFQCRTENADSRPATVSGLSASSPAELRHRGSEHSIKQQPAEALGGVHDHGDTDDTLLLRWERAERAEAYHVYWRRRTLWRSATVSSTSKRIADASKLDEVVVVASNSFGNAHPARLVNVDAQWLPAYQV